MEGGIKLTEDGGIIKFILTEGSGTSPKGGQEVVLDYIGRFIKGEIFDGSVSHSVPFKFVLGIGSVIKGWDIGLLTMKRGEKAKFIIDSKYCYGEKGSPPRIPPNTPLEFEIELFDFYSKRKPVMDMKICERENLAEEFKKQGNENFKIKKLRFATYSYQQGIHVLGNIPHSELSEKGKQLLNSLQLNLCIVLNSIGNWSETIKHATEVVTKQENHPKARYLKGVAELGMKMYEEALIDFEISLKGNPEDEKLKAEIEICKQKKKEVENREKKSFAKMFEKSVYDEKITASLDIPPYNPKNIKVFMDIKMGTSDAKRVIIELFSHNVPKTAENFKCLCTGEKVKKGYKGIKFHRIIPDLMMQGGDVTNTNGVDSVSIYGKVFDDENFIYKHFGPGIVSMANRGKNTNGSQFFITFKATPHLDKQHVVFGRVVKGMKVIREVEKAKTDTSNCPIEDVVISDCGVFTEEIDCPENCS